MASEILGPWWHLPAAFVLTLAGIYGHELTHAVMMWPVAEEVRINVGNIWMAELEVESDIKNTEWRHRYADVAGLAPVISGTLILSVLWISGTMPDLSSVLGWGFVHGLLWFALFGGLTDYSRSASRASSSGESLPPLVRVMGEPGQAYVREQQFLLNTLTASLTLLAVTLLYLMAYAGVVGEIAFYGAVGSLAIVVCSSGLLLKRLTQYDVTLEMAGD